MSNGARIGLLAATVVVLVLAFVLLSPGDDDEPTTAGTTTTSAPVTTGEAPAATTPTTTTATDTAEAPPAADHEPAFERVHVRDGKPLGGVQTIEVQKGERARIEVVSTDTSDEVHLHGYDIERNVKPGSNARFSFKADAEGIFEIELHGTGTQIAKLVVEP